MKLELMALHFAGDRPRSGGRGRPRLFAQIPVEQPTAAQQAKTLKQAVKKAAQVKKKVKTVSQPITGETSIGDTPPETAQS